MARVRAGFAELRRAMRRELRGYSLVSRGGSTHFRVVGPDGEELRQPDGRPLTVCSSPSSGHETVRKLIADIQRIEEARHATHT